jgi:hypothetical protein
MLERNRALLGLTLSAIARMGNGSFSLVAKSRMDRYVTYRSGTLHLNGNHRAAIVAINVESQCARGHRRAPRSREVQSTMELLERSTGVSIPYTTQGEEHSDTLDA